MVKSESKPRAGRKRSEGVPCPYSPRCEECPCSDCKIPTTVVAKYNILMEAEE